MANIKLNLKAIICAIITYTIVSQYTQVDIVKLTLSYGGLQLCL